LLPSSLLVDTRPEYVTAAGFARALDACPGKPLEVGIGLKSASSDIPRQRIHKGYTWELFATAARLMAGAGAELLASVMLKPINTGEREAIEDSVATGRKVFALGRELKCPTRVVLEPCVVAPQSPLYHAFEQGRCRPPWLWSVVEVVSRIASIGWLLIGLSDEGMNPFQTPRKCEHCTGRFRQAMAAFNRTQDPAGLGGLSCECHKPWIAEAQIG
jgi:radical SAM enzyme (TIGR01210 family)